MIAYAIGIAREKTKMPDGVFSMVHGKSVEVGMALVRHPSIKAVGFTGSFTGGKALYDAAVRRDEPIPVYAEMGSSNPVFILPEAMRQWGDEIAKGLTNSVTLGVGQFCTNPGLTFYNESDDGQSFQKKLSDNFSQTQSGTMLTQGIYKHYADMIGAVSESPGVKIVATGKPSMGNSQGVPSLMQISFEQFVHDKNFEREIFGPSTIAITMKEKSQYITAALHMKGHLTATLWGTDRELEEYKELIDILAQKVGRVIINGFPTGVEVTYAMVHGGTFPATTDSRMTSVGTAAIYRFTRPVCYQNFPDSLLPDELKNTNLLEIWRLVNGEWSKKPSL